jgi:hypothetical protein
MSKRVSPLEPACETVEPDTLYRPGEVSEWPKERDWKSRTC